VLLRVRRKKRKGARWEGEGKRHGETDICKKIGKATLGLPVPHALVPMIIPYLVY
jgi:hypothetical protein